MCVFCSCIMMLFAGEYFHLSGKQFGELSRYKYLWVLFSFFTITETFKQLSEFFTYCFMLSLCYSLLQLQIYMVKQTLSIFFMMPFLFSLALSFGLHSAQLILFYLLFISSLQLGLFIVQSIHRVFNLNYYLFPKVLFYLAKLICFLLFHIIFFSFSFQNNMHGYFVFCVW